MNRPEMEEFRQRLLGLRAELLKQEDASKEADRQVEPDPASIGCSRRDAMHAEQMAQEGTRQLKRRLQKIDGALRRIETGEYGRCFVCEEELDARRLSEDPAITRCANCVEQ